ncbi:hypothetical protein SELMODRAFT_423652 [Selaginella moellendorffii]|uniref:Uncharacterized protein n=1 Tax=Selaginella moellendorffii TaxID=88036 RepID=D8SME1_SELML|nr:hypothetical protein SELMODRAFT_423652 [Selaginella moellendorffii]
MVCRPVELLTMEEESKIETAQICSFKLNRCRWFPCSVLNSEKCHCMTPSEWHTQENRLKGKLPAFIELLNNDDRLVFGGKHLHRSNLTFEAGYVLQIDSFLVVVHREETKMQWCYYAEVEAINDIKGIYAFASGTIFPDLCKAGKYKVEFSIDGHPDLKPAVWEVNIKSLGSVSRWHIDTEACTGITLEELVTQNFTVQGFDTYDNLVPFSQPCSNVCMVLEALESTRLSTVSLGRESMSFPQKDKMNVGNFIVRGCILPAHDARLCFYVGNQKLGHWRCQVYPGKLARLELVNSSLELPPSGSMFCVKQPLDPDCYFPCMVFKGFDEWGNSVRQGTRMLSGVHLSQQEVETDGAGIVRLSELRVAKEYNMTGSIVLSSEDDIVMFEIVFKGASRTLKFASEQQKRSYIGREVTGLNIHVVDEDGTVSAKGTHYAKTPGLWEGRAWHSDYQLMSLAFEIQVELAAACKPVYEEQVIAGGCGEEIAFKFEARDELNLPGFLSNEIVEQMEVEVFPEEDYLTDENVLLSRRISSTEDMKYSLRVVLDGKEGFYVVTLKNAMQTLNWRVYLGCGDVHRLVPFCGKRNELLKALMTADAGRRFSVCRRSFFPELQVCLVDHKDNVCNSGYKAKEVSLEIIVPDTCERLEKVAYATDGFAAFQSFWTCRWASTTWDDEQQVVPEMRVLVECEDGRPLQALQQLTISVWDPLGKNCSTKSGERDDEASVYIFQGLVVLARAGPYVLKFVLEGSDEVTPIKWQLNVVHGRPYRLKFNMEQENTDVVVVDVVDIHDNRCFGCREISLRGTLTLQRAAKPAICCMTAINGQATFSDLEIMPELFTFKVCAIGGEFNDVKSATSRLAVLRGNYSREQVEKHLYQYIVEQSETMIKSIGSGLKECHKALKNLPNKLYAAQESLGRNTDLLKRAQASLLSVYEHRRAANDDEVLLCEGNETQRTEGDILNELKTLVHKENSPALALYTAQEMKPIGFPLDDILGPIVLLARVEKDEINSIRWLRSSDANVDNSTAFSAFVRSNKLWIPENFPVFRIDAIKQYKRKDGNAAVDAQHPQKLLNIPPPVLSNGEIPAGFLGYGVNFLYLRPEHLELRQSLFYHVFRKLQVYNTEENMLNAWNEMSLSCQAVSLDGGRCDKGQVLIGSRRTFEVPRFASVPYEEREQCSLVPAAASAFTRNKEFLQCQAKVEELQAAALNDEKELQELEDNRQELEMMIEKWQKRIPSDVDSDDFCKQMQALQEQAPDAGSKGTLHIYLEEIFEERMISHTSREHRLLSI